MIRRDIHDALIEYRKGNHPYPFGGFVTAVLANDLVGAFLKADVDSRASLPDYVRFLSNDMPGRTGDAKLDIWGSYEAVANTIASQRAAHAEEADEATS